MLDWDALLNNIPFPVLSDSEFLSVGNNGISTQLRYDDTLSKMHAS